MILLRCTDAFRRQRHAARCSTSVILVELESRGFPPLGSLMADPFERTRLVAKVHSSIGDARRVPKHGQKLIAVAGDQSGAQGTPRLKKKKKKWVFRLGSAGDPRGPRGKKILNVIGNFPKREQDLPIRVLIQGS